VPQGYDVDRQVVTLGYFLVPLFFVHVGASVDLRALNPADPANRPVLVTGALLLVVAVASKFAAGYVPVWFRGRKDVIGVGMVPRGEVELIFAQMGLTSGVLDQGMFGAVTLMAMATTFIAPPLLKWLFPPVSGGESEAVGDVALAGKA
jgi:Kef-type K+ transport system membrane component KefB